MWRMWKSEYFWLWVLMIVGGGAGIAFGYFAGEKGGYVFAATCIGLVIAIWHIREPLQSEVARVKRP